MRCPKLDGVVRSLNYIKFVIPAKAGIQLFQNVPDPGACPGHGPGVAGVTTRRLFTSSSKLHAEFTTEAGGRNAGQTDVRPCRMAYLVNSATV